MKWMLAIVASLSLIVGIGAHLAGRNTPAAAEAVPAAAPPVQQPNQLAVEPPKNVAPVVQQPRTTTTRVAAARTAVASPVPVAKAGLEDPVMFGQAIDSLLSTQIAYADKQALWKELKNAGRFDDAIAALEKRAADDPNSADTAAMLGEAYLKKCGMTNDMRQQAIFAMKADQTFETALGLDSNNWDARFYRAVSMSYWPANLNKGQDVIDNFQTLIQQQEAKPPQPQYALPYLWLGDQYQKSGSADLAAQVWQRGASLFPDNPELKGRLTGHQ